MSLSTASAIDPSRVAELLRFVETMPRPRVLLVGDWMLDEYIYGNAERLSPEAPVPVVSERYRTHAAGGAGNVAVFLAALEAEVIGVGVRGRDAAGDALLELLRRAGVDAAGILPHPSRPTCRKTRLVGLAQHRHPQQMLRLDAEDASPIDSAAAAEVLARVRGALPTCDMICLEDYNKGLLTESLCQEIIASARSAGKPVLVDPAPISNYQKYAHATAITPNRSEAELATGLKLQDAPEAAPQLAAALATALHLEACILTLDRHGMYLQQRGAPGQLHPTRPRTVYDVTGAGDMVLAMLAMARAAGASWADAVDLGNVAGGLEVEKFGCVPVTREEIARELLQQQADQHTKQLPPDALLHELGRRRAAGQKIVFTNGVFDILHAGHVRYLQFARSAGDLLVVGLNGDASVRRLKGPARPVNTLADRAAVLEGLAAVDYIVSFDEDTPEQLVQRVAPDVLVKGDEYAGKAIAGAAFVQQRGGKVVLAPMLQGRSTSAIIARSQGTGRT